MSHDKSASQLEEDLLNEARERIKRWTADTIMRCNAAELPDYQSRAILLALATELVIALLPRRTALKDLLELMEKLFRSQEKFIENCGQSREES
jgi:hypothetical protein